MNPIVERPNVEHYRYAIEWCALDGEFVATVTEFPSLSWLAMTQIEALRGVEALVKSVIDDMIESGEGVPEPLSERKFSGRVVVRVDPSVHRKLVTDALRHGTSLNKYAAELLSQ